MSFLFHVMLTECEFSGSSTDFRVAKTVLDASTIFYYKIEDPSVLNLLLNVPDQTPGKYEIYHQWIALPQFAEEHKFLDVHSHL